MEQLPPPNIFANDGSFFDQFRKKMANQSKMSDAPSNPNCQKQRPGFKPKTACKPINLKASLKKQLKSKTFLPVKSTLDTTPPVVALPTSPSDTSPGPSTKDIQLIRDTPVKEEELFERQEEERIVLKRSQEEDTIPVPADNTSPTSTGTRKRKKKSRWGEMPAEGAAATPIVTVINGVPVVVPPAANAIPQDVTVKALASLLKTSNKKDKNKYEYDSDEETDAGTWEHKQRAAEIQNTAGQVETVAAMSEGKHHLGDFLPSDELERFMMRATAIKNGKTPPPALPSGNLDQLTADNNIGYKMLQNAGWKEGTGLGANASGIVQPIDRGMIKPGTAGLGASKPDEPLPGDDEFDVYRKRMMLAYKYRPNPMKNPRRAYY